MAPPVKSKWTPEAEKAAAKMWNANVDTNRIILTLKADYGLAIKAPDLHSLFRRKGGVLGMIDGSDRQRAARPERVANRKVKKPKTMKTGKPDDSWRALTIAKAVEGTPLHELRAGQCRFPLTKSLPHLFCTKDAVTGSWCAEHLEIIKGKKS